MQDFITESKAFCVSSTKLSVISVNLETLVRFQYASQLFDLLQVSQEHRKMLGSISRIALDTPYEARDILWYSFSSIDSTDC